MLAFLESAIFLVCIAPILYFAYQCSGGFFTKVFGDTINTTLFLAFGVPAMVFVLCLLGKFAEKLTHKKEEN